MLLKLVKFLSSLLVTVFSFYTSFLYAETRISGLLDLRAVDSNTDISWIDAGLAPTRFAADDDVALGQAVIAAHWQISNALSLDGVTSLYDDAGNSIGINELYIKYAPAPRNPWHIQAKAGSFFPEISLENTGVGWTSRVPLTNSAINTWIGEEVKLSGVQVSLQNLGKMAGREWDFTSSLSLFVNNDPTGSMLAWRGWAMHDRQLRLGEEIAIADLPTIGSEMGFENQSPYYDPFTEVDDRPGYALSMSIKKTRGPGLKYYRYDNRANPVSVRDRQYGWHTRFDHLSFSYPLRTSTRVIAQWLSGSSLMGFKTEEHVDIHFSAWFLSVTEKFTHFRLSIRYETFNVEDRDRTPMDDNRQKGDAWTLGLRYDVNKSFSVAAEYIALKEKNYARKYFNQPIDIGFSQSQLAFQWRF